VRELAMALLQIEQMVEGKYLNPPLGKTQLLVSLPTVGFLNCF
jgi:hypothetical protein